MWNSHSTAIGETAKTGKSVKCRMILFCVAEEFFVDVLLPVTSTYESEYTCSELSFTPDLVMEQMRVQDFIETLSQCMCVTFTSAPLLRPFVFSEATQT